MKYWPGLPGEPASSSLKTVGAGETTATVSGLAIGTTFEIVVRATHSSGATSANSNQVSLTTRIGISSPLYRSISPGTQFSYQVRTSPSLTRTNWQVTGLADGLSFDPNTGIISGIPTGYGVFPVTITAEFSDSSPKQLDPDASLSSSSKSSGRHGCRGSFGDTRLNPIDSAVQPFRRP